MRRFNGRATRRGFAPRAKANVQWVGIDTVSWTDTATTASALIQLQGPTDLSNLTSDPPEDLTILRMIGDFEGITLTAAGSWVLALTVQDTTWTPTTRFEDDADKRILWYRSFSANVGCRWDPGILVWDTGGTPQASADDSMRTRLDIAPRVRIEPGKALFLVRYEQSGTTTFAGASQCLRVLYKRSGSKR